MSEQSGVPLGFIKDPKVVIEAQALVEAGNGAMGSSTSLIEYRSHGQCLIVGDAELALSYIERLDPLKVTIASLDQNSPFEKKLTERGIKVFSCTSLSATGHLGQFDVRTTDHRGQSIQLGVSAMTESGYFDVIMDLGSQQKSSTLDGSTQLQSDDAASQELPVFLIDALLPPFGYYRVNNETSESKALDELPDLIGEFEKPKYFNHKASVCAHQRSLLTGCTRCIDVCSTSAISSAGEIVAIDPYLCQGCGHCATVCPSGAMTYAYPKPADAIVATRGLLAGAVATARILLLYKHESEIDESVFESTLPGHVLPVAVEEVGAFGLDYWAAVIASGIEKIVLYEGISESSDSAASQALQLQIDILQQILGGMKQFSDASLNMIVRVSATDTESLHKALSLEALDDVGITTLANNTAAKFATHNDKRQTLRFSVDHLLQSCEAASAEVTLPAGSPFGKLAINSDACTLCLACVSTCPSGALLDGQSVPQLRFIEANCVQCGICTQACPEEALNLVPQFLYDSVEARKPVVLHEEEPFNCVICHKPFATRAMIDNMTAKLAGHWMFEDEQRMRRLKMCEDCRVKDMFSDSAGGIEVHREV